MSCEVWLLELTLVKVVLVLLALDTTASGRVELVADAAEEATTLAGLALLVGDLLGATLLSRLLAVTAGEFLDKVHDCEVVLVVCKVFCRSDEVDVRK